MFKRLVDRVPGSRVIYQDHQGNCSAPEYIKWIKSLIQSSYWFLKIKLYMLSDVNNNSLAIEFEGFWQEKFVWFLLIDYMSYSKKFAPVKLALNCILNRRNAVDIRNLEFQHTLIEIKALIFIPKSILNHNRDPLLYPSWFEGVLHLQPRCYAIYFYHVCRVS